MTDDEWRQSRIERHTTGLAKRRQDLMTARNDDDANVHRSWIAHHETELAKLA